MKDDDVLDDHDDDDDGHADDDGHDGHIYDSLQWIDELEWGCRAWWRGCTVAAARCNQVTPRKWALNGHDHDGEDDHDGHDDDNVDDVDDEIIDLDISKYTINFPSHICCLSPPSLVQ